MISLCSTSIVLFFALIVACALVGAFGNITRGLTAFVIFVFVLGISALAVAEQEFGLSLNVDWDNTLWKFFAVLPVFVVAIAFVTFLWRRSLSHYAIDEIPVGLEPHTKFTILNENGEPIGWCTYDSLGVYLENRPGHTCRLWNDMDEALMGI